MCITRNKPNKENLIRDVPNKRLYIAIEILEIMLSVSVSVSVLVWV